jgi:glycerophosphoryl diester phosphodiesterase
MENRAMLANEIFIQNAKKVKIEGHRGGKFDYDNSFSTFNSAVEHKLDSIEFDVWLTSDRIPVVLHGGPEGQIEHAIPEFGLDENTYINTISFEQIRSITLPNGEKIPTLEELIDAYYGKIEFNCEIKDKQEEFAQILIDLLLDKEIKNGFFVSSFHPEQLERISKLAEFYEIPFKVGYLYDKLDPLKYEEFLINGDVVSFDINLISVELVNLIHQKQKLAATYFYPPKDESDDLYLDVIAAGVDIIITDRPLELRTYIRNAISLSQ